MVYDLKYKNLRLYKYSKKKDWEDTWQGHVIGFLICFMLGVILAGGFMLLLPY